jgi:hypothetical protein
MLARSLARPLARSLSRHLAAGESSFAQIIERMGEFPALFVEGQSLAAGFGSTDYLSPASSKNFAFVGAANGSTRALTFDTATANPAAADLASLVALQESTQSGSGHTVLTTALDVMQAYGAEKSGMALASQPAWNASVCARSGQPISSFITGQWPMLRMSDGATAHAARATALGKAGKVAAWLWMQGESNNDATGAGRSAYKTALETLLADVKTNLANPSLLQGGYQTAGGVGSTVETQGSTMAQWDLFKEGKYNIVAPAYFLPDNQSIHLSAMGEAWLGAYFGRFMYDWFFRGVIRKPLHPTACTISGGVCTITFSGVEGSLVLDTENYRDVTDATLKTKLGFRLLDGSTAVDIGIPTVSGNQVTFTCPGSFSGVPTVRYACDQRWRNWNQPPQGSGNLRDSSPDRFVFNGYSYPLYNHCIAFDWQP